jgi:hypothetical protein
MILFFLCAIPSIVEAWLDRRGQTRKGKFQDTIILLVVVIVAAAGTWRWLGYSPLAVPSAVLIWRVCVFDYMVHAFLKRYSEGHRKINIWTYTGTTTFWWDQLVAKVHPVVRLVVRFVIFAIFSIYSTR